MPHTLEDVNEALQTAAELARYGITVPELTEGVM